MKDCLICFCPIESKTYSCSDPLCTASTCLECTEALVNFSHNENIIPKCPSTKCNSYYLLSGLKGLSPEIIEKYTYSCLNYMLNDRGEKAEKEIQQANILEQLRKEREKFIKDSFPAAVALVTTLTFTDKIRKLEKQRSRILEDTLRKSHRKCMNTICNGNLDQNMRCLKCITQFCQQCEKVMRNNHKCLQSDVDSIQLINQMIRCPKCHLPVIKEVGCNSITCSNCGTNFEYSTGKEGGHGSMNAKIMNQDFNRKLSVIYRDYFDDDMFTAIQKIENKQPKVKTDRTIITILKKYYQDKDFAKSSKEMAKYIDIYFKYVYATRYYYNLMGEIEFLIMEKKLTLEKLLEAEDLI